MSPLERAITGALRSAIRDHGPITPEHVGSAAKRVLGNLRNARAPDPPAGEAADVLLAGYACACARCGHEWTSVGAEPPEACPGCKSRSWRTRPGEVRRGRPPNSAA